MSPSSRPHRLPPPRYRAHPIIGTALGSVGLVVMAFLPVGLPLWGPTVVIAVVGIGTEDFMNPTLMSVAIAVGLHPTAWSALAAGEA